MEPQNGEQGSGAGSASSARENAIKDAEAVFGQATDVADGTSGKSNFDQKARVDSMTDDNNETEGSTAQGVEESASENATELETLQAKVTELEYELQEKENDFLRARADLENARRRMEKEKSDFIKYGLEGVMKDLLPCLDSFEQATSQAEGTEEEALRQGVDLVKRQLFDVLGKHGLSVVESDGAVFDPSYHQAIRKEESSDVENETVGQVYQAGYTLNGRLLRPAMVSVLMPTTES